MQYKDRWEQGYTTKATEADIIQVSYSTMMEAVQLLGQLVGGLRSTMPRNQPPASSGTSLTLCNSGAP